MDLITIDLQHSAYVDFLASAGKTEHVREMCIEDLQGLLNAVSAWNADIANKDNQIVKIGVFNTLRNNDDLEPYFHLINSYLVGLDSDGVLVKGGGAGNPVPPHCCPS